MRVTVVSKNELFRYEVMYDSFILTYRLAITKNCFRDKVDGEKLCDALFPVAVILRVLTTTNL